MILAAVADSAVKHRKCGVIDGNLQKSKHYFRTAH